MEQIPTIVALALFTMMLGILNFRGVVRHLLATGHAYAGKIQTQIRKLIFWIKCADSRENERDEVQLGGSAAYTLGLQWFLVAIGALFLPFPINILVSSYFAGFGLLQLAFTWKNAARLTYVVLREVPSNQHLVAIKAHLGACGASTSWGPCWFLYWISSKLQKGLVKSCIGRFRDCLTIVDFAFSLPMLLIVQIIAVFKLKVIIPLIWITDFPEHQHH